MALRKHPIYELLDVLLNQSTYMTMKELSEMLDVSEKTVWNRLHSEKMQEILGKDIHLITKTNAGIAIDGSEEAIEALKKNIQMVKYEGNESDDFRRNKLLMKLLMAVDPITTQEIADGLLISKKQVMLDLEVLSEKLKTNQLELYRKQNVGLQIIGDEINIRQLLESTILQQTVYYKHDHHINIEFDEGVAAVLKRCV